MHSRVVVQVALLGQMDQRGMPPQGVVVALVVVVVVGKRALEGNSLQGQGQEELHPRAGRGAQSSAIGVMAWAMFPETAQLLNLRARLEALPPLRAKVEATPRSGLAQARL